MQLLSRQGQWRCYCHASQKHWLKDLPSLQRLIADLESLPITLKDNHRSAVKRGDLFGRHVVAKQPRDKHRRRWSKLMSIFSAGEARSTVENLAAMQQAGVQTVTPLFALERRAFAMVVDSWICYEYRAGEPCGESGLQDIVALLEQMHQAGFRHDDPTWNNFLRDADGVLFTIDTKAKPCRGAFHATYDFIVLKRANKLTDFALDQVASLNRQKWGYKLAVLYSLIKAGRSELKDKLKKNRPKNI